MFEATARSLIAAEHKRRAAIEARDLDALEAMTADHFHYAHVNGLVESREAYFARLREGDIATRITATSASDLSVTLRQGYALLDGRSRIEATSGLFETLFLSVWEPDGQGWKIVAYASTPLGA
jgi:hypothetical protein